jgi:hypothetical protein
MFYIRYIYYLHRIFHWFILGIYLLYDIFIVIYQEFARYMTSIYLVVGAVEVDMAPCRQSHQQEHHRALSLL